MKKRKTILLILGSIVGGAILIFTLLGLTVRHISRRLDCERFNIDNIEIRTQTDIPDLNGTVTCIYHEKSKIKSNHFIIDTSVDMKRYITRNDFVRIEKGSILQFATQLEWNNDIQQNITGKILYTKSGTYIGEESGNMDSWLYILDSTSGDLWMEVKRTKHH